MIFASPIFLFLFLPIFLIIFYLSPPRARSIVILVGSSIFYAWWRVDYLVLLYGIIAWNWLIALGIEKWRNKWLLRLGVAGNLLTLGYFKYWNFGVNSLFAVLLKAGVHPSGPFVQVLLPIGI